MDEIGMVGVGGANDSRAGGWDALIKTISITGSKFMVVGDDHQAKPVEAGDVSRKVFRDFKDASNLCALTEIQRQKVRWMKEASGHLAELRTGEALGMYEHQGHIQQYETNGQVYQDIARQYLRNLIREPDSDGLVMAYTNEEVRELNGAIRRILKENGLLSGDDLLTRKKRVEKSVENQVGADASKETPKDAANTIETEGYTIGDKIVFTQNDRGFWTKFKSSDPTFFVRNGTQGYIESIKPCQREDRVTKEIQNTHKIAVRVEEQGQAEDKAKKSPSTVTFYLRDYSHFQHGYAVTIHKTQGATGDGSLLKLSPPYMDAYTLYVAMTRHRGDIGLYYSKQDFADFKDLIKTVGKVSVKDLAADYSILEENMDFWSNVQEYKALGFELLSIKTFAKSAYKSDKAEQEKIWTTVRQVEKERKELAKLILEEWDTHGDFVRQAGITFEALEIAAGLKKRSLSRREEQAQLVVEQYASIAIETRQAWRTIRRTHPGSRAKEHPEWQNFEILRDQRGVLANRIIQDPVLYRPFLKEVGKAFENEGGTHHFGYGLSIIKTQAEAHQSKILQKEMLKNTSDPELSEKLKTLLEYVEARDLSASLWRDLKPKLKQVEGTLLSEGFCKEIADWTESRMARDQLALKIVDSWEDYSLLIQKVGMKLTFEKLIDQKEQAVRDTLFKTYATSQDETAKLHSAFELKALMDEEAPSGKKVTVAQVYHQGLQPKDITHHALKYQKLKLIETVSTESERHLFRLLVKYDDQCREANQVYVTCLEDIKERKKKTGEELKPWDSSSWSDFQQAALQRNAAAFALSKAPDFLECLDSAKQKGWDVNRETMITHAQDGYRQQVITQYEELSCTPTTESEIIKAKLAHHFVEMIKDDQAEGHKKTLLAIYQADLNPKDIFSEANDFKDFNQFRALETEEERHLFELVYRYKATSAKANEIYRQCVEESKVDPRRDKLPIKISENPLYPSYLAAVSMRNESATALLGADWEGCLSVAEQLEVTLDEDKPIAQSRDGQRQTLLDQYRHTDSTLVKYLIARELKDMMVKDQRGDQKVTAADLYRHNLSPKDIQGQAKQFDRMGLHATLTSDAEQTSLGQTRLRKQIFSLLERYDTLVTQANEHYKACCQEAAQQNLKKTETASYALFQEVLKERQEMASVIQHTGKPSVIAAMAEDMGISSEMLNKDSHAYDMNLSTPKEVLPEAKTIPSVPVDVLADKGQSKPSIAVDPYLAKREVFERGRFALNQEWCEKFHFYQVHKRFPNPNELADIWWQAERLTAIEGRLFHRNLHNDVSTPLPDLSQQARQEFLKNADITPEAKETIKTAHLMENQIVQVEQHILFHRDKIGEDTTIARIQEIIEAIKIHAETKDDNKGFDNTSHLSKPYSHLIEQQEILADRMKHKSSEGSRESSSFLANKEDKIASLNLQISRTVEFEQDCQQREMDRGRGMSV